MTTWVCGTCGGENPEAMGFCGHCGNPRAAAGAIPGEEATPPRSGPAATATTTANDTLRSFVATPVADRLVEAGGHIAEERRLITALFADISGFTALAEQVDTEELVEIIDPIVARLSAIVGRYDGYVEKFAGDALLALFGAPVAHEDDASRALLVALEMQREILAIRDELPTQAAGLTLHVGVNSGHGIARVIGSAARLDYGVLGDSVILAQRLESAAPSGQIYVGSSTHALTQRRFAFESVGDVVVKGKTLPVPAWRLIAERDGYEPAVDATARRQILGREAERAAVADVLDGLVDGRGAVLTIVGEAGIGKSTLVGHTAEAALEHGVRWLATRCLSYGSALAYRPIAELVRGYAHVPLDARAEAAGPALRSALEATDTLDALPWFRRLLGIPPSDAADREIAALEPEAIQRGLQQAVAGWLETLARSGPVAVLVEDAHWIDLSSLSLIEDLAASAPDHGLLLVLTARPEATETLAAVERAAGAGASVSIALGRLERDAVEALAAALLDGASVPPALVDGLVERTGGNPYFVEEVVRGLIDSDVLRRLGDGWTLAPGWDGSSVPPTVEGVLASRLDHLPSHSVRVLQAAAVIGRRIRGGLLRAVLATDSRLDAAVDDLVRGGFLDLRDGEAGEELWFHHALVQDVAYARLLRRQRRDLHHQVATAAEALYGAGDDYIDLLARHLYLGGGGIRAVEYLERAGDRARQMFANGEAALDFERAAEVAAGLAPGDAQMAARLPEIRLQLADLLELQGRYAEALVVYREVADSIGDIRAWRGVAAILRLQGEYEAALSTVTLALDDVDARVTDARCLFLERAWTLSLEGRLSEARAAVEAGFGAWPGVDATRARLLVQLGRIEIVGGTPERGLGWADEAAEVFAVIGDLRGEATADRVAGDALRKLHRMDEAADRLRRGLATAEWVGSAEELGACLINLGMLESDREHFGPAAEAFDRASAEFQRSGNRNGEVVAASNLADLLVRSGSVVRGREVASHALGLARELGNVPVSADVLDTLAQAARAAGEPIVEAETWDEASATYETIEEWPRAAETAEMAAAAWEHAGEPERARDRRSRARAMVERESVAH